MEELPEPNNPDIQLHKLPAIYAATIRFSGYADGKDWEKKASKLADWLKAREQNHSGHFINLGYNPPYQVINRRNEVMVELVGFQENEIE